MKPFNTAAVVMEIGVAIERANYVAQDPAVQRAARRAWCDVAKAGKSIRELGLEIRDSWGRSRPLFRPGWGDTAA